MNLEPLFPWRTGRVELFLLDASQVTDRYLSWLKDGEVTRYLECRFQEHDLQSIAAYVSAMRADPDVLMLGIRKVEDGHHVGNIKLGPVDRHHRFGEIGLMIGDRDAWGAGLATDAIAVVATIAERQLGLRKLTAGCYASNVGSRRAFEKAGFHVEGRRLDHYLLEGRGEDLVLLARRLEELEANQG